MHFEIILMIFFFGVCSPQEQCRTANGDAGKCILLETCTPLLDINKKPKKTKEDIKFLRQSDCGLHLNVKPKVCCPPENQWNTFTTVRPTDKPTQLPTIQNTYTQPPVTRPTPAIFTPSVINTNTPSYSENDVCHLKVQAPDKDSLCCGKESASFRFRISGGKAVDIDQYPWLALIEYSSGITGCGGSLLSARYVLTAGHCLVHTQVGAPVKVRLAEYNTTTFPIDTVEVPGEGLVDNITVLVVPVQKTIVHPLFHVKHKTPYNDIGLIKLSWNAPYTYFIRPICLPYEDITVAETEDLNFWVAGWGSTGVDRAYSDVKQHVNIPYVPTGVCKQRYAHLPDSAICAGGEKGKDSCTGDSGGPLMHKIGDTFILTGIVSYGDVECGKEGSPAVYTHVYKYLEWINSEMV